MLLVVGSVVVLPRGRTVIVNTGSFIGSLLVLVVLGGVCFGGFGFMFLILTERDFRVLELWVLDWQIREKSPANQRYRCFFGCCFVFSSFG